MTTFYHDFSSTGRFLGDDGWRVASALTARHIGGAVNYMAVTESLGVSPSIFGTQRSADSDFDISFHHSVLAHKPRIIQQCNVPFVCHPIQLNYSDEAAGQ
jgi:uncharacterized membrane protein